MLFSTFPHSPLRTGHATFTAPGSPGIGDFPHSRSSALLSLEQRVSLTTPRIPKVISNYSSIRTSIPCRPSPCTRLSRAPSTMAAPTPLCIIGDYTLRIGDSHVHDDGLYGHL
jgi:hypothetical protein